MQRRVTFTIDETAFVQLVELATHERRSARDQGAFLLERTLRLQELARLQRRSLKDQAAVLLEASLEDRPESSAHLVLVGAGTPGAA